jgi:hypothetical protein
MLLLLLAILVGAVLGMRFRVLVLIPAIGLTVATILAAGMIRGESVASFAITAILAGSGLQIGYLAGAIARYATAPGRTGRRHGDEPKAAPNPVAPRHSIGGTPSTA